MIENEYLRSMRDRLKALKESEGDCKAYRKLLKVYRDNYAIAVTEREEGRAEGRAEGRSEHIRIMLSLGISPDLIAEKYGISIEEVKGYAEIDVKM